MTPTRIRTDSTLYVALVKRVKALEDKLDLGPRRHARVAAICAALSIGAAVAAWLGKC